MSKEITAPMPGTIVKLEVKKGQDVAEGETLLFLEAMKMENAIVTPVTGKVSCHRPESRWCGSVSRIKRQRRINMITYYRPNMDKPPHRRKMIQFMKRPKHKKVYRERSYKVEPMQGLVKDIFELDRFWR